MKRRSLAHRGYRRRIRSTEAAQIHQSAPNHFQDLGQTLAKLRTEERWSDLHFVCQPDDEDPKGVGIRTLHAHRALFMNTSPLLSQCLEQAHQQAPGCPVYVTLVGVDPDLVEKMLECLYLGRTTVQTKEKSALNLVLKRLGLTHCTLSLDDDVVEITPSNKSDATSSSRGSYPPSSSSSSNASIPVVTPESLPRRAKARTGSKKKKKAMNSRSGPEAAHTEDELKAKARRSASHVPLKRVDQSTDRETQRLYQKALASEAKAKTPVPQKRRIAETSDKKSNIPKKMKADETSSEYDSDEVQARKKEALISDRSLGVQRKRPPPKNRRASNAVVARDASTSEESRGRIYGSRVLVKDVKATKEPFLRRRILDPSTSEVNTIIRCHCGSVFLSEPALRQHQRTVHESDSSENEETPSERESPSELTESEETTLSKPVVKAFKKKSVAKIRQERRQSRRFSSNESELSDSEPGEVSRKVTPDPKQSQPTKKPLLSPVVFSGSDDDDFLNGTTELVGLKSFDQLWAEGKEAQK